jgi:hypothetical protein
MLPAAATAAAAAAAAGVERRSNAPLAGKEVHVINYCCDKLTQSERDAAKQRVGEMLARNGAKQVAAPLRTVSMHCSRSSQAFLSPDDLVGLIYNILRRACCLGNVPQLHTLTLAGRALT